MASAVCASSSVAAVAAPSTSKVVSNVGSARTSFLAGRALRTTQVCGAAKGDMTVSATLTGNKTDRPLWLPGSEAPKWLDGSLPGDYGFDPLDLAAEPGRLNWMVQAELVHCRWAMLGAAGIFIPELLTKIGILNTPSWYKAGDATYFADQGTLFIVELLLMAWAESRRWADIARPGSVNTDPIFPNNKLTGTDVGYPGGLWFDPLGWGSGSEDKLKEIRTKEVKNGRLAMLAVLGAFVQANVTHVGPIDNLFAHLADPYHTTILQSLFGK
ncbi:photosystem I chlorophyll a/b-binding protein 2, chloroplastic [Physcomitrium patens]|uniref:Chlorophyll a-b binding protein, chloroplastic n=1 Tax=Physcomitrium patens TaxID=3218 RepID=A0A2K1K0E4_PHYPA|nr:photosystem I chlorophyll a/b-binding protein 2, chloroplastic-like [Physcomitrium patens]XP_024386828.1 photosystem I chlorophyll a/b-binding protein 2, chloroplastic-like [Physcomitrium patens]PNR47240.1 hypothetical protein PHYPA_014361 [Physcomitrium patens]8HTU_4 Chain 4, Chlorophyll a-b binding protein, chloroplastic [Physcomitrium patens]8HTU_8 Chain 8, Chlorophyll a-b binding protein, chloroplastic [Physcomitrium patens]|eukprot:XP_024386371.1 photosystem I chlorophyll a/b-binding protein 2, chloroplastic-like [Physcomitrella patens]